MPFREYKEKFALILSAAIIEYIFPLTSTPLSLPTQESLKQTERNH